MKTKPNNCRLLLSMLIALMIAGTINSKAGVQTSGNVFTNASFNNGEPYYQLIVGVMNSNAGLVVNGGSVFNLSDIPTLYPVDRLILGLGATTNNSVTVDGVGSKLMCNNFSSGGDTFIYYYGSTYLNQDVGIRNYDGNGDHVTVSGGGGLECFGNTFEGQGAISLGTNNDVLVTDAGSHIVFNYGFYGDQNNTISVLNGAAISGPGISLGSSNTVLFSDFGTSVDMGLGGISGDSFNSLTVSNGASLKCYQIQFGGTSNNLLFDGAQTLCFVTNGILFDPNSGNGGKLTIQNGARVTSGGVYSSGNPATQTIVSDPETILTITSLGHLYVGGGFPDTNAVLIVTNGASVALHNNCLFNGQLGLLQVIGTNSSFTASTNGIFVGNGGPGGNIIQIGGGGQVVVGGLQIGYAGNASSNSMTVAGSLYVTNSTGTAVFELHDARATCNGGLIVADQLICGLGGGLPGILTASSGTLQFKSATVTNGLPLVIGDGTNTANYVMQGGTHSFASGLLISSNSVLSGCGTVAGSVTNYGTILLGGCDITFSNAVVNFGTIIATNGLPHFLSTLSNQGSFVINPPAFQTLMQTNGVFKFNWSTVQGVNYQVQYKTNLVQTNWINLGSGIVATNSTMTISDSPTNSQRFYRIRSN